jgi:predicted secreted protein
MEIFGFVISVWAAIIMGLFFIAMIFGCTLDRRGTEAPKWYIMGIGVVAFVSWFWSDLRWSGIFDARMWTFVGLYLLIGLGYSIIEFLLEVRRSARYWSGKWEDFKKAAQRRMHGETMGQYKTTDEPTTNLVTEFLHWRNDVSYLRIIGIEATADGTNIEPKINRQQLAESIGCWTIFWPFYALSLIFGDLLNEVFRIIADLVANISGRFVRMAFKDVFKL